MGYDFLHFIEEYAFATAARCEGDHIFGTKGEAERPQKITCHVWQQSPRFGCEYTIGESLTVKNEKGSTLAYLTKS